MTAENSHVQERILDLAKQLIQIPSRGGIDPPQPVLKHIEEWCADNGIAYQLLFADGEPVGLTAQLSAGRGYSLCLDACVDTAPFGDENVWKYPPTAAVVEGGRLYGRGAADSKLAVAMFLVLLSDLKQSGSLRAGTLRLLLDADEHTGGFRGAKEFVRATRPLPNAVWIGYPGNDVLVAGSRGFLRGRITVAGQAAHTGGKRKRGINAISRAARLVEAIEGRALPTEVDSAFQFGPSLTVTAINGGEGFSVVPDRCDINLDIRLTPNVTASEMRALVESLIRDFDETKPAPAATTIAWEESWPAFRTPNDSPAIAELRSAASRVFGRSVPTTVSGPSNIGNYLAPLGVSPMAGFGVTYDNIHGTDEWCDTASIGPVYETYRQAVLAITGQDD